MVAENSIPVSATSSQNSDLTFEEKKRIAEAITGIIPQDITLEDARAEKLGIQ